MIAERKQSLSLLVVGLLAAITIPWLIAFRDAPPGGGQAPEPAALRTHPR